MFPAGVTVPVQLRGSTTPVISLGLDFAVDRPGTGTNGQFFYFAIYDAIAPMSGSYAYHSEVIVGPDNTVYTESNQDAPYVDTGLVLSDDLPYHLQTTVDYDTSTWSAELIQGSTTFDLVNDAPIDGDGYTLSGYTTPTVGWANVEMYASQVSSGNDAFADRLFFNNYTVTAPEKPAYLAEFGIAALGLAMFRRKRLPA
jgi:hypothetical protein